LSLRLFGHASDGATEFTSSARPLRLSRALLSRFAATREYRALIASLRAFADEMTACAALAAASEAGIAGAPGMGDTEALFAAAEAAASAAASAAAAAAAGVGEDDFEFLVTSERPAPPSGAPLAPTALTAKSSQLGAPLSPSPSPSPSPPPMLQAPAAATAAPPQQQAPVPDAAALAGSAALLAARFRGHAPADPRFHRELAARVAAFLDRAVAQSLAQWPYAESRHVALVSLARRVEPALPPASAAAGLTSPVARRRLQARLREGGSGDGSGGGGGGGGDAHQRLPPRHLSQVEFSLFKTAEIALHQPHLLTYLFPQGADAGPSALATAPRRALHVIPFLSDVSEATGVDLPTGSDEYWSAVATSQPPNAGSAPAHRAPAFNPFAAPGDLTATSTMPPPLLSAPSAVAVLPVAQPARSSSPILGLPPIPSLAPGENRLQLAERLQHLNRLRFLLRLRREAAEAAARASAEAAKDALAAADTADTAGSVSRPQVDGRAARLSTQEAAVIDCASSVNGSAEPNTPEDLLPLLDLANAQPYDDGASEPDEDTERDVEAAAADPEIEDAPKLPLEAGECLRNLLEAQLLSRLHPILFHTCADDVREQAEADRALARVARLAIAHAGGVTPAQVPFAGALAPLSVPAGVQSAPAMRQAFAALQRLGSAASAEAKMERVADACSLLTSALRYGSRAGSGAGATGPAAAATKTLEAVGADELLPALMWLLLYSARVCDATGDAEVSNAAEAAEAGAKLLPIEWAPPPSPLMLIAHCAFIERFRDPSQMFGRAAYCMTHLRSSLHFLVTMGIVEAGPVPPALVLLSASENVGVVICRGCLRRWSLSYASSVCERCGAELPVVDASVAAQSAADFTPPPLMEALPLSTRGAAV
jgi:hypothetical protein